MWRQVLSVFLCVMAARVPLAAEPQTKSEKMRARLVEMQAGSIVEVVNRDGRWKGRLGELGSESFSVKVAGKDRVEDRLFRYDEVKSAKNLSKPGMHVAAKITLGVLVGLGVFVIIGLIYAAAHGWDS